MTKERALKDYWKARTENLKDQISIFDVLDLYNIEYRYKDVEVQFPCPLHGDGSDKSFSARAYQDTDTTYCWACKKVRDQIQWVRDFEGTSFSETIKILEQKFNIEDVPSIYEYVDASFDEDDLGKTNFEREIEGILTAIDHPSSMEKEDPKIAFRSMEAKIDRFVEAFRSQGLSLKNVLKMYSTLDSLKWDYKNENVTHEKAFFVLQKLATYIDTYRENK